MPRACRKNQNQKRLTNRTVNKWVYDFIALNLARLRTPGVFQKLHRVGDADMPRVLNAILKMERRFQKKAQGAEAPLTELGQTLRSDITVELWAALLVRPRNNPRRGTDDDRERIADDEPDADGNEPDADGNIEQAA